MQKINFYNNLIKWLLLLLTASVFPATAQQSVPGVRSTVQDHSLNGLDINGLLVDETITKVGRDFYEIFYQQWNAPESSINYTLFVREKPRAGIGSQIAVYMNDTEVFAQNIQPRYDMIEAAVGYAVDMTYSHIQNYESITLQLGSEDQQGTGIY